MSHLISPSRLGRYTRLFLITIVLTLLFAMTTAVAPAQEQTTADDSTPLADADYQREPIIVSETRRGDVMTITVDIPAGADTFTTSNRPTTNWETDPNLRVGFNLAQGNGAQRIFMFFDISVIPANAVIRSANLRAFLNNTSPIGDAPMGLLARFLSSPWDASILTWQNFNPSWGAEIGVGQVPATSGWIEAPVTNPVREWYNGTRANNGIMIQGDETPQQRERVFTSLNTASQNFPRLRVTYDIIIDTTPPTSSMTTLPQWSQGTFNVQWTGTDNDGGSGIKHYDVQFRNNGGAWQNWQTATTATSATFTGQNGVLHEFRVRAVDNFNNVQAFPVNPQTGTTVDTIAPTSIINALPQFTFSSTFTVGWTGSDAVSGLAFFDVEYQENNGPWKPFITRTTLSFTDFTGAVAGSTYGFRVRAVDRAGNAQPFTNNAQATTTVSLGNPQASIIPFIPNIAKQPSFVVQWVGQAVPGSTITSYDVQVSFNDGPWQTWLSNFGGTNATYNAQQGDGIYAFRVRARDNIGRLGEFSGTGGNAIALDAVAPFITIRAYYPIVIEN